MEGLTAFFCFFVLFLSFLQVACTAQTQEDGIYIVYMGAASSPGGAQRNYHNQLLSSLIRRNKKAVLHTYSSGFLGFAARLSREEVKSISQRPGVVSVFQDPVMQLHTTRSWDFLKHLTDIGIGSSPSYSSSSNGADTIIGILDTGIWPEAESFSDEDMSPIPARWKGTCMEGQNFTNSNCNRKLIGARFYDDPGSLSPEDSTPRDQNGHGTHVASTAAGVPVTGASYYGLATGTAKGGSPGSRIAVYRICPPNGCRGSAILKAFDDAIVDGVDVLSLSLGGSATSNPAFSNDAIAIGAFHAVQKGITVVCSAGNSGPRPETVVNVAPWILTVAATTIDRDFQTHVVLGGNKTIKGGGISLGSIHSSPAYPLIYGSSAKSTSGNVRNFEARNCNPGSLDEIQVIGKIVVCQNDDDEYTVTERTEAILDQGGRGVVLIDDDARIVASKYGSLPIAAVDSKGGAEILSYINSTRNPVAMIIPTVTVANYKPAPAVAYFSSRGPSSYTKNILKVWSLAAPGVDILAAWPANDREVAVSDKEPPLFNILSGTSMACPHVTGVAAAVKSQNPTWSPSAVKSAIMTTAIQTNNLRDSITSNSGSVATPYDVGAGEVSTSGALHPGLVYETTVMDYLWFLCNIGYDISKIKLITATIPDGFSCPEDPSSDSISSMNYPSIAVAHTHVNQSTRVTRTVTNVGEDESTYTLVVDAPSGLTVEVTPDKLQFTERIKKLSYEVIFKYELLPVEDLFGSITWTNTKYTVRSPFVVAI